VEVAQIRENSITIEEIFGQPSLWQEIYESVVRSRSELQQFMRKLRNIDGLDVVFTGAGSSAFVGECVAGAFGSLTGLSCRVVPTTDIVTHPRMHVSARRPTLLVSFARSGNSPESVASVDLASKVGNNVHHLIITCNKEGALAKRPHSERDLLFLLPERSNDRGLAMIGSVTGMILAAILIAQIDEIETQKQKVEEICSQARELLETQANVLNEQARSLDFDRVVCLGSGALLGLAHEAHLKIQELSDGAIIGKFDSFLGFRHGPKAVLNEKTLMIYFLSSDPYVAKYEADLVRSIDNDLKICSSIAVSATDYGLPVGHQIVLRSSEIALEDHWLALPYLLPAQLLAAFKSRALGLNPDSPSKRGAIHRVVQGVNIYPFT